MPRYVIERTFPDGLANPFNDVINFKTLTVAAAVLSSVVFAMPASSQAMPQAAPVKIDAASNGNLVQVYYRGYCRDGRCYAPYHRYVHYHEHYRPYYGYYRPYYGYYRPHYDYYRPYYGYYRPYCDYYPVTVIYPGSASVIEVQGACRKSVPPAGQDGDGR
jgi:hypothetical protein